MDMSEHRQQCRKCGGLYKLVGFRRNGHRLGVLHASTTNQRYCSICIGCQQTARDERKVFNRWHIKASDTLRRHAPRLGFSVSELIEKFRWNVERIEHDLRHAYDNTCGYCRHPYKDMGHKLADITLDIVDRDKPPHYDVNVKPCCNTCNREKSTMSPQAWAEKLLYWEEWERNKKIPYRLPLNPEQLGLGFI